VAVWDVFGKRTADDEWTLVGGITAPDLDMALVMARETHFRHKEGVAYAVRRRGEAELCVGEYDPSVLGGVTDHSYRRQEAYAGVGGRMRKAAERLAAEGRAIDRPRPSGHRAAAADE
jgi:1,2-phenylacetyl-CoA epoxidase PaaB subunit